MALVTEADMATVAESVEKLREATASIVELTGELQAAYQSLALYYKNLGLDVGQLYESGVAALTGIKGSAETQAAAVGHLAQRLLRIGRIRDLAVVKRELKLMVDDVGVIGQAFVAHAETITDLGARLRLNNAPDPSPRERLIARFSAARGTLDPTVATLVSLIDAVQKPPPV